MDIRTHPVILRVVDKQTWAEVKFPDMYKAVEYINEVYPKNMVMTDLNHIMWNAWIALVHKKFGGYCGIYSINPPNNKQFFLDFRNDLNCSMGA
jgi:hypothetical protein